MADPEEKRKQVARVYAGMDELELKELAEQVWSLTKMGQELLRAELDRRELGFELVKVVSASPEGQSPNLVTLPSLEICRKHCSLKAFLSPREWKAI